MNNDIRPWVSIGDAATSVLGKLKMEKDLVQTSSEQVNNLSGHQNVLGRGLPRQLTIHLCARDGGGLRVFSDDIPEFYMAGAEADVLVEMPYVLTTLLACNYEKTVSEFCKRGAKVTAPQNSQIRKLWDTIGKLELAIIALGVPGLVDVWDEPRHRKGLGVDLKTKDGAIYRLYYAYLEAKAVMNDHKLYDDLFKLSGVLMTAL
jgi:hypothetical protein